MICPGCGQHNEQAKFCANCGVQLSAEQQAATADPTGNTVTPNPPGMGNEQQVNKENDFVKTVKKESANFGQFFLKLLKGPDNATKMNSTNMTPAIITMVIFSLLIALGTYLAGRQVSFIVQYSFLDSFVIPLLQFLILFAVVIGLTFAGTRMAMQSLSFTDVIAKVGAYTVPFLVLTIVGSLLTLVQLTFLAPLVLIGLIGPILIVPTLIILEKPANRYDRIYILLGIYVVSLFVCGFLIQNIMNIFLGGMMDGIMGGLF